MIILFFGENTVKSKNKLNEFVSSLLNKKNDILKSSLFEIEEENFDEPFFKNLLNSHHLFGEKNLVVLKNIFENKEIGNYIIKNIENIKSSENIFTFLEKMPEKEILETLKKYATKILEFKNTKNNLDAQKKKNGGLTLFNLTDAFAQKNSKTAWLILQKLLIAGINEEEIFWKIFWQTKNIAALKPHQNENPDTLAEIFKIHPFVAKKTLAAAKNFSKQEISQITENLIEIYRENRYNKIELSLGLERLILNL